MRLKVTYPDSPAEHTFDTGLTQNEFADLYFGSAVEAHDRGIQFDPPLEFDEPVAEAVVEPVAEVVVEPVAEAVVEPVAEAVVEPVAEAVVEPVADEVKEPK